MQMSGNLNWLMIPKLQTFGTIVQSLAVRIILSIHQLYFLPPLSATMIKWGICRLLRFTTMLRHSFHIPFKKHQGADGFIGLMGCS